MLELKSCSLVVVDVQGKLAQLMYEKEALFKNIQILIKAAKILQVPIIWCEQVPARLGPTVPEIAELLVGEKPVEKSAFSCCRERVFNEKLKAIGARQVLLCGIETHVCIWQTAMNLLEKGYDVTLLGDAVSSRTFENKRTAIERMNAEGVNISTVEMALFELLKDASEPNFKEIASLVR